MRAASLLLIALPGFAASILSPSIDPNLFQVTVYVTGVGLPQGMVSNADGSIFLQTSPAGGQLLHLTDVDGNGVADAPGTVVATTPSGYLNQLVSAGPYLVQGDFFFSSQKIQILAPGATLDDPMTEIGSFTINFPAGWLHPTIGLAARPTPGMPGHYDVVFNVGAQFNGVSSAAQASMTGLMTADLDGESLYMVTLDLTGGTPVASGLTKVATGIRNVFGLAFAENGDLYFSDNAIDAADPSNQDPPQADELNRIPAADLGAIVPDFGFPDCYPDYATGATVGSGCIDPLVSFGPLGTMRSQGAAEIAFAPIGFPDGFNNGMFVGFSGRNEFDRNPLIYYDFDTDTYVHFIAESTIRPIGLLSTQDALYIADWNGGTVYRVTAVAIPEPGTGALAGLALITLAWLRRRPRAAGRRAS